MQKSGETHHLLLEKSHSKSLQIVLEIDKLYPNTDLEIMWRREGIEHFLLEKINK